LGNLFSLGFGAGLVLFSGCLIYSITTQRFYADERSPTRFGMGISRVVTPVEAAAWLNDPAHGPKGTMWTDYDSSSDLYYFTRPHRDVPILTNTWAYPPQVMAEVLGVCRGEIPFEQVQRKYDLQIAVLSVGRSSAALARRLAENASWKLVFLDGLYVVFLRADGPNAEIAAKFAISAEAFDRPEFLAAYLEHLKSLDPVGYNALHLGGLTLYHMGWDDGAIAVFGAAAGAAAAVNADDRAAESWDMMGLCLARRGTARLERLDQLGRKDWDEARQCFLRALDMRPGYSLARDHLGLIESQIANFQKGILLKPRYD
jgi:tetratricopeptide (TPR) repeat protein